ncbi:MAG: hypothetical protein K6B44_13045 [Lachnospiraceae bacterium]|nr:hypothetical protein [Lachnospiraceae bacterium]
MSGKMKRGIAALSAMVLLAAELLSETACMKVYAGEEAVSVSEETDDESEVLYVEEDENSDSYAEPLSEELMQGMDNEADPAHPFAELDFEFTDIRTGESVHFDGDNGVPKLLMFGGARCSQTGNNEKSVSHAIKNMSTPCEVYDFDIKHYPVEDVLQSVTRAALSKKMHISATNLDQNVAKLYSTACSIATDVEGAMPLMVYLNDKGEVIHKSRGQQKHKEIMDRMAALGTIDGNYGFASEYDFTFEDIMTGTTASFNGGDGKTKILIETYVGDKDSAIENAVKLANRVKKYAPGSNVYIFDLAEYVLSSESGRYEYVDRGLITSKFRDSGLKEGVPVGRADNIDQNSGSMRSVFSTYERVYDFDLLYIYPRIHFVDEKGDVLSTGYYTISDEDLKAALSALDASYVVADEKYDMVVREKLDVKSILEKNMTGGGSIAKYSVEPKGTATVSKKGILTAKKAGNAMVTAYIENEGVYTAAAAVKVSIVKPQLSFTPPLTYTGETMDALSMLSGLKCSKNISWKIPASKSSICTINEQTGLITAGTKSGSVKVSCLIGDGKNAAKYTATLKVKLPKIKKKLKIKEGKSKKLSISNTAKDAEISWSSSSSALEISATEKPTSVMLTAVGSSSETVYVKASVNGIEYVTEVTIE